MLDALLNLTPDVSKTDIPRSLSVTTDDFDDIATALFRWDSHFTQLQGGPFQGRLRIADWKLVQLFDVSMNRTVTVKGGHPSDTFAFSPIVASNSQSQWRGMKLRPGMFNIRRPGDELDHLTGSHYHSANLIVDGGLLRDCARIVARVELDDLLPRHLVPLTMCSATQRFAQCIRAALDRSFPQPKKRLPDIVGSIIVELITLMSPEKYCKPDRLVSDKRKQVVRRAEEWAIENSSAELNAIALCSLTGVSQRTLEYAFRDITGLSPVAYLKAIRLNRARRELQRHCRRRGIVHTIGSRWGFGRPDHFAADYKRLFGELPSAAVGRKHTALFPSNYRLS